MKRILTKNKDYDHLLEPSIIEPFVFPEPNDDTFVVKDLKDDVIILKNVGTDIEIIKRRSTGSLIEKIQIQKRLISSVEISLTNDKLKPIIEYTIIIFLYDQTQRAYDYINVKDAELIYDFINFHKLVKVEKKVEKPKKVNIKVKNNYKGILEDV